MYGRPETVEYGISSFVFRAKRPFHPERLYVALGSRLRPGALAGLLRLKGFAWLATRPRQQAHAALAGTQFTISPGRRWVATIPEHQWPDGLKEEVARDLRAAEADPTGYHPFDRVHGDRRIELVCIGREFDKEAASAQLEACLLTPEEMERGPESWLTLPDPFAPAWMAIEAGGGHAHAHEEHGHGAHGHEHGGSDTAGRLRKFMDYAKDQVRPP